MKSLQILTLILLSITLITAISCNTNLEEDQENVQVTDDEGSPSETVNANGELQMGRDLELSFEIGGKLGELYYKEGDKVKKDAILAELQAEVLELALNEARAAENNAKTAYYQSQVQFNQNEAAVDTAAVAVAQSEIALKTAEYELEQTQNEFNLTDINAARAAVEIAERDMEMAFWTLGKINEDTAGWSDYQKSVFQAEARLNTARDTLDAMLFGFDTKEITIKKLSVDSANQTLGNALLSQKRAQHSMTLARQSMELAEETMLISGHSVKLSENRLNKATLVAPFDGEIAIVNYKKGRFISPGLTVIHIIDPDSLEINVEVDEIDIPAVKLGQRALIEIDALPDLLLEGKVVSISLLPTINTGLVMYDVIIEFDVPIDIGLKAGMSVTVDIVITE
ncbi:HlyD family secretion protein [Chloroflexota bacterium]